MVGCTILGRGQGWRKDEGAGGGGEGWKESEGEAEEVREEGEGRTFGRNVSEEK